MADEAVNTQTEQTQTEVAQPTPEQVEWQQRMDYQFMDEVPVAETQTAATINEQQAAETEVVASAPSIDYTPFIKENFGIESIDEFKTQWGALQELKANPPTPSELKFENEFNEKLFKAIHEGKTKEVYEYLGQQQNIERLTSSEVTDETADEIIKLGMKYENSELTQREIDFKFRKEFALPKEPVLDTDDEDSVAAHNEWKELVEDIKMSKSIAAKMMKPKLEAAKSKIQFPDILTQQSNVDPDYEAYKARNAKVSEQVDTLITPAIKALKETDVQLGFKVTDPNNQMDFEVALSPTPEAFEKARQDSLSFDTWFQNLCYDKDGKFHPERVQRLILLNDNYDNYATSIARQAVNAERKAIIAKETVSNNNGARNYSTNIEKSELQKNMDAAFS